MKSHWLTGGSGSLPPLVYRALYTAALQELYSSYTAATQQLHSSYTPIQRLYNSYAARGSLPLCYNVHSDNASTVASPAPPRRWQFPATAWWQLPLLVHLTRTPRTRSGCASAPQRRWVALRVRRVAQREKRDRTRASSVVNCSDNLPINSNH